MNLKTLTSNESENLDEAALESMNDTSSKTKIRRTRLKMLFEEFQNEIASLEEKIEKCTSENAKLKFANEDLRQQLDDSTVLTMKIASESIDGSKINNDISTVGDISTIIKLSNKLQEMIHVNENITRVNTALRKDLKNLTSERDVHIQDITKLREENKFSRSTDAYSKYSVVTLKDQVDNYEREIHQWKNAMKRADDYISDLGKELDRYKRTNNNNNETIVSPEDKQENNSPLNQTDNRNKRVSAIANNSATEALQKLVSQVDSTQSEHASDECQTDEPFSEQSSFKNPILELSDQSIPAVISKQPDLEAPVGNETGDLFSDPIRFPACVKLLELTKARQTDDSLPTMRSSPSNEPVKHFSTPLATDNHNNMLFWNNGNPFANGGSTNGGPVVHHRATPNIENRSNKGEVDDDITIVLPSSDHSLINQISRTPETNQSREMLFHSPINRNFDTSFRSRMEQEFYPSSDNHLSCDINTTGDGMLSYYPPNAYPMSQYPPLKKIKIEDVYK